MFKRIDKDNELFKSEEFQKDKYKFFLILQNLSSNELELYSDEKNYVLCRGGLKWPTWIWTKDNFDKDLVKEVEEAIELYRLDTDTRYTAKREFYNLLVEDKYESLGDYYFEMGFLECNKTVPARKTDGYLDKVTEEDREELVNLIYDEHKEISDVRKETWKEAEESFDKRLATGNYYVWKNDNDEIVAQAFYRVEDGCAKVAGVMTKKEERCKGYAANLIYHLTNDALAKGYHVSLYTDYQYIPSNRAYKNVGYVDKDVLINFSCKKKVK